MDLGAERYIVLLFSSLWSDRRNGLQLPVELCRLPITQRLLAITHGALRLFMDLDDDTIRPGDGRGHGDLVHERPHADTMAGIGDDRLMCLLLEHHQGVDVEGIPVGLFIGADAPFAQHDLFVAMREDVLRCLEQFFNGAGDPSFEEDRLVHLAQGIQKVEVLAVARTYLEDVDIVDHVPDLFGHHHLGNDSNTRFPGLVVPHLQAVQSHAPKAVGRRPGLVDPAPHDPDAIRLQVGQRGGHLFVRLDAAGSCHDDEAAVSDPKVVPQVDGGVLYPPFPGDEFIIVTDAMDIPDAWQGADAANIKFGFSDTDQVVGTLGRDRGDLVLDLCQFAGQEFALGVGDGRFELDDHDAEVERLEYSDEVAG